MAPSVAGRTGLDTVEAALSFFDFDDTGSADEISFPQETLPSAAESRFHGFGAAIFEPGVFREGWTEDYLVVVDSDDTMTITTRIPWDTPTIESTPGVCGGAARVRGTRIPIWILERFRQLGATAQDLLAYYPSLTRTKLRVAQSYARRHQDEIGAAILRNEAPSD